MNGKKIKCIVTGRETYFSATLLKGKIKKFGSLEEFEKHYVCRDARKELKAGKNVEQARESLNQGKNLPKPQVHALARMKYLRKPSKRKINQEKRERIQSYINSEEYKRFKDRERQEKLNRKITLREFVREFSGGPNQCQVPYGGTCLRPDIRVNGGGFCDGCDYYDHCLVARKKLYGKR